MAVTVAGMVKVFNEVQPEKALLLMELSVLGNVTEDKFVQPINTSVLMFFTEDGMVMEDIPVQFLKV